jgi:starvation-inducible DNA-binding protein
MANNKVADKLKEVLASSYFLYLKTQNYHWNVTGSNFGELHGLFQKQYEDLADAIDEIAERIRALDVKTPGSFKEFAKLSSISEAKDKLDWKGMVKDLLDSQLQICKLITGVMSLAQKQGDEGTFDMLVGRIKVHEKNKWMLKSYLG